MKENYYYIDESKGKANEYCIYCMIQTDVPDKLSLKISELKENICNDLLYKGDWNKLDKIGFHVIDNHPRTQERFISLIKSLSFRAFLVIDTNGFSTQEYKPALKKLLLNSLQEKELEINNIIIEQDFSRPSEEKKNIKAKELETYFKEISSCKNIRVKIVEKHECSLISIPDYIAHIVKTKLLDKETHPYVKDHYELIEPKIGFIYDVNSKRYFKVRTLIDRSSLLSYYK